MSKYKIVSNQPTAEESCDGYDNDCDGLVDNDGACDLSCDAAEPAGGDVIVTNDPSTSNEPALVWNGSGYGLVWSDARDGNLELYYSGLDPFGQIAPVDVRLTSAIFDSLNASLIWTGDAYATSWCDKRSGSTQAYFARFDASGAKLTPDVLLGSCLNSQSSLAWSGSEFGVVWVDGAGEVLFARLDATGSPVGLVAGLTDGAGTARGPALAWSGSEFAAVWHAKDAGNNNQIYFTRVDISGSEIGSETAVTATAVNSRLPDVVWSGAGYGVAWAEAGGASRFAQFALLDAAGALLSGPTALSDLQTATMGPSLAWSGSDYGVSWRDTRHGNGEVYFSRVDASGAEVGSELRLTDSPADSLPGPLVWTGTEFAIAWSETPQIRFARLGCNCFDADADGLSSCNDNCDAHFNPSQSDLDGDFEGDHCDLDDGEVYILFSSVPQVDWQQEQGFDSWNYYKGDLDELLTSQLYTQAPGSNALAARQCGLGLPSAADATPPAAGKTAFFLVAAVNGGLEDGLGEDSSGVPRPNAFVLLGFLDSLVLVYFRMIGSFRKSSSFFHVGHL